MVEIEEGKKAASKIAAASPFFPTRRAAIIALRPGYVVLLLLYYYTGIGKPAHQLMEEATLRSRGRKGRDLAAAILSWVC